MRLFLFLVLSYPFILSAQSETAADAYGAGVRAFYAEDYKTALSKYSEALTLKPNTIGYLYSRALTYQKLYRDSLANIDFHKVVILDPTYIDAWYWLGMIQMDEKHYDSAYHYFSNALRISPNDVAALHQLGLIMYYKRKYFDAIDIYSKIINIKPDDGQAYYKRGLAKFNDEDFEGAAKDFTESYTLDPDNTLALEQSALSYLRENDLENACRDWDILLKKGNSHAQDNINLYCGKK
jgi:tetratricopeptide (TPR) repeat protein